MATQAPVENRVAAGQSQTELPTEEGQLARGTPRELLVEEGSRAARVTPSRKLLLSEQLSAGKIYGFRG